MGQGAVTTIHGQQRCPPSVWRNPVHWLAFGFGSGCAPRAPGTAGTLVAVPIYLLLSGLPPIAYLVVLNLVVVAGIYLCGRTARDLGVHDHGGIVWDEIAGFLLTMAAAPPGWGWLVAGVVLFRLFDIAKPWPIALVDARVAGGLGIMADDLLAAVYAGIALQALAALLGSA